MLEENKISKEKPIRIAQIMGKLWAGGVEAVVFNYYRAIDKNKIQFDFFYDADSTVEPPQDLIDMGARFYKIPPYQKLPIYLKTLRRYFREGQYRIVHSHINTLSVFPLYAAWREHIPVRIAHNHSVPGGGEIKRNILKNVLRFFSKVFPTDYFACSEKAGRWLFGNKAFDAGKVFVVKNAIDFNKFKPNPKDIEERKKQLGLDGKFVVGHVGRFTYAKNHEFLIKVFAEVLKQRKDAVLLLVGGGELQDEIESWIEKYGVKKSVVLAGQVTNPEKYYGLIDVMAIPSLFEGLSLTTIESQVAGVPVVVSEAVPDEAIISNGCKRIALDDNWADTIIEINGMKIELDNRSEFYEINEASKRLMNMYTNIVDDVVHGRR